MNLFSDRNSVGARHYSSLVRSFFALALVAILPVFIWAVMTQRIELRKRAATSESVVCWNRVSEMRSVSTDSLTYVWNNDCKGDPTRQNCNNVVSNLSATEVYGYINWKNAGKPYIAGCGMTLPTPTNSTYQIDWTFPNSRVRSQSMTINISNKQFHFIPDSGTAISVTNTPFSDGTIAVGKTWHEHGDFMSLNFFFKPITVNLTNPSNGKEWLLTDVRIVDPEPAGAAYHTVHSFAADLTAKHITGQYGYSWGTNALRLVEPASTIEFTNLELGAFLNMITPTPTTGYCKSNADCPVNNICSAVPPGGCGTRVENGFTVQVACASVPRCYPVVSQCGSCTIGGTPCSTGLTCQPIRQGTGGCTVDSTGRRICYDPAIRYQCAPLNNPSVCMSTPTPSIHNWCPGPNGASCNYDCNTCNSFGGCTLMKCPPMTGTCTNNTCVKNITPTPVSCSGANGTSCTIGGPCPTCIPGQPCPAIACKIMTGICQDKQCIPAQRQFTCQNLTVNQSSYFTMCAKNGYNNVCFNKFSGEYQGCSKDQNNDCTVNNTNAAVNILCPVVTTPSPSPSTKAGDLNGDNVVNIFDYNIVLSNFGKKGTAGFILSDLIKDGVIDLFDYNALLNYFGK